MVWSTKVNKLPSIPNKVYSSNHKNLDQQEATGLKWRVQVWMTHLRDDVVQQHGEENFKKKKKRQGLHAQVDQYTVVMEL